MLMKKQPLMVMKLMMMLKVAQMLMMVGATNVIIPIGYEVKGHDHGGLDGDV